MANGTASQVETISLQDLQNAEQAPTTSAPARPEAATTDLLKALQRFEAAQQPPATIAAEGGTTARDVLGPPVMAVQGVGKGLLDLAGFPADVVNAFLGTLEQMGAPTRGRVPGGSRQLTEAVMGIPEQLGMEPPAQPISATERIVERTGREVGGGLGAVGLMTRAGRGARAPVFLQQLASMDQGKLLAVEGILSTMSGGSAGVTRELTANPLAEMAAQLGTAFGVPAALRLVRWAARLPAQAVRKFTGGVPEEKVPAFILRELRHGGQRAEANLEDTLRLQQETPEFQPSLGQAADVPELTLAERGQARRGAGAASVSRARRDEQLDMIIDRLESVGGATDADVGLDDVTRVLEGELARQTGKTAQQSQRILTQLRARRQAAQDAVEQAQQVQRAQAQRIEQQLDRRLDTAEQRLERAREPLGQISAQRAGEIIREDVRAAQNAMHTQAAQLYENIDPLGQARGPVPRLFDDFDRLQQTAAERFRPEDFPAQEYALFRTIIQNRPVPSPPARTQGPRTDAELEFQEFIRRQGGIRLAGEELHGELQAVVSPRETGTTGLVNDRAGITLQDLAERAQDAGFLSQANKEDAIRLLERSLQGRPAFSIDNPAVMDDLDNFFTTEGAADAVPAQATPDDIAAQPVSFEQLKSFRSALLRRQREQGPNSILNDAIQRTNRALRQVVAEQGDAGMMQRFTNASSFYRRNISKFTTGAGEEILRRNVRGREGIQVPNSQVAARFFSARGDATERAQEFIALVGDRPTAVAALHEYAATDFLTTGVLNPLSGKIQVQRLQAWIRKHQTAMEAFPELQADLSNVARAQQRVEEVMASSQRIRRQLTTDVRPAVREAQQAAQVTATHVRARTAQVVKIRRAMDKQTLQQFFGPDVARGAEQALRVANPRELNRNVVRLVNATGNDTAALQGLRRAFIEELIRRGTRGGVTQAGKPILDPQRFLRFTQQLEPSFKALYSPKHLQEVKRLAQMLIIVRRTERSPVGFGSDTYENLFMGDKLKMLTQFARPSLLVNLSRRIRRTLFGRGLEAGARFMTNIHDAHVDALLNESLFNPDIAATLRLLRQPSAGKVTAARLHAHLVQLGLESRPQLPEISEQPETIGQAGE